jgi:hypothetical protein
MVSSNLPPQCLQFNAQEFPVTEMDGKSAVEEQ